MAERDEDQPHRFDPKTPTDCVFMNQIFVFWVANDGSNRIWVSASTDGVTWPPGHPINGVDATPEAPSACVFNN